MKWCNDLQLEGFFLCVVFPWEHFGLALSVVKEKGDVHQHHLYGLAIALLIGNYNSIIRQIVNVTPCNFGQSTEWLMQQMNYQFHLWGFRHNGLRVVVCCFLSLPLICFLKKFHWFCIYSNRFTSLLWMILPAKICPARHKEAVFWYVPSVWCTLSVSNNKRLH